MGCASIERTDDLYERTAAAATCSRPTQPQSAPLHRGVYDNKYHPLCRVGGDRHLPRTGNPYPRVARALRAPHRRAAAAALPAPPPPSPPWRTNRAAPPWAATCSPSCSCRVRVSARPQRTRGGAGSTVPTPTPFPIARWRQRVRPARGTRTTPRQTTPDEGTRRRARRHACSPSPNCQSPPSHPLPFLSSPQPAAPRRTSRPSRTLG